MKLFGRQTGGVSFFLVAAFVGAIVIVVAYGYASGPFGGTVDRHVPGATTGPGKNLLFD